MTSTDNLSPAPPVRSLRSQTGDQPVKWQRKHRIECNTPGLLFSGSLFYDVAERTTAAALAVIPAHIFRFRFYEALRAEVDVEGAVQTVRKCVDHSPWHYVGGTIYTADEVAALEDDHRTLLANMRCNGWDRVIHTPLGNWHPWESEFVYVERVAS